MAEVEGCGHGIHPAIHVCAAICRSNFVGKSGVGIEHFGPTHLRRMWICHPPLTEQREVVAVMAEQTTSLDAAISRLEREVELLREYRTRLVADVVTGKLDVREAAARLPEEAAVDIVEDAADANIDPETGEEEAA